MRYKVGMYGGAFDPLHIGHVNNIIEAASLCEELYIVLSYSRKRDSVPMEYRYRWIYNSFKHMSNVKIILLEDMAGSKEAYEEDGFWEEGRDYILSQINKPVDVVFCGSDYKGTNRYENLYKTEVYYFDRSKMPISSTDIRSNPLKNWDYLPRICRPYYVKKVLIVGGESTGKSTLAQNLAAAYNTNFLEEVGRDVCNYAGNEDLMISEDFQQILLKHKLKEQELIKESHRILFVDTDALTTKFYSHFLLLDKEQKKRNSNLADAISSINNFDLILFLEPTVAFVQGGTRNPKIEADREKYSNQLRALYDEAGLSYYCIGGNYLERFNKAKELIEKEFKI